MKVQNMPMKTCNEYVNQFDYMPNKPWSSWLQTDSRHETADVFISCDEQ